jgi:hypothetical protein
MLDARGTSRLLDVREDPVELVQTVVADDELAAAASSGLNRHACPELLR